MSLLIKGMEMPTRCYLCPFCDYVSARCDAVKGTPYTPTSRYEVRADWCPLVPVPKHGRLIDADALMLKILDYIEEYSDVDEKGWHNLKWCAMKEAEMAINAAPTIIPAEEGE